ncbi:MAG TPA: MerR family transcriptional regulator [Segetibacter sp.]|jgi:DNA-binding transcriptional MerR regulator
MFLFRTIYDSSCFTEMNAFTIKDLENLSGIKAHTIRIWEQRYTFLKPQRTTTNIRYYSNDELKMILNVSLLNKYGYKISHINKMNDAEISSKIYDLSQAQAQQDRIVKELIECMIYLDLIRFEKVIDNYIHQLGIETAIADIFFPFLERIGILWLTNHINPAQEHLVSNIIRQKIIVGIENSKISATSSKSILLYLPEGEYHELGLLFTYYLLKQRGITVLYLGANVPLKDVEYIVELKKPDSLFSHVTSIPSGFQFEKFISQLGKNFKDLPVTVSGWLAQQYKKEIPANVVLKRSLKDVYSYINSL